MTEKMDLYSLGNKLDELLSQIGGQTGGSGDAIKESSTPEESNNPPKAEEKKNRESGIHNET